MLMFIEKVKNEGPKICAKVEGRGLLNWYKYNSKLIKQGKLSAEREQMIHNLEDMRSGAHTGGRKKIDTTSNELLLDL